MGRLRAVKKSKVVTDQFAKLSLSPLALSAADEGDRIRAELSGEQPKGPRAEDSYQLRKMEKEGDQGEGDHGEGEDGSIFKPSK